MEQLPISTHIAVVKHSGGKLPVSNANTLPASGVEGDFANLLAAQIGAQDVNGIVTPGVAGPNQPAPADAPIIEVSAQKDGEQASQQLAEVLTGLPLPLIPIAQPVGYAAVADDKTKPDARLSLGGNVNPVSVLAPITQKPLLAEIKPVILPVVAAKTEEAAAIFAATDKAVPPQQVLDFDMVESKQAPLIPTHMPTPARAESAPVQTPSSAPIPMAVDVKVGTPGWDTAFSQRVAWAATNQHQVAELHLNPPNLGPVEIRITVSNDQATAVFVSPHASVRDSIEAALPRLREMLGESGLSLGNVNVSSQSFQQQQQAAQGEEKPNTQRGGAHSDLALISDLPARNVSSIAMGRQGLVDIFA